MNELEELEKKLYQTDMCSLAIETNANIVIRTPNKVLFLPIPLLQRFEETIGKGKVTLEFCLAFCRKCGEDCENSTGTSFGLVARGLSKEEALKTE